MQGGQHANRIQQLEKGSGRCSREQTRTTNHHLRNNYKASIQYAQEHYFPYDAKRATDALATGRGQIKGATGATGYKVIFLQTD